MNQQQQALVFSVARHSEAIHQAAATFIEILTDPSLEVSADARDIVFRTRPDHRNSFFVEAHGVLLLAKYEHVFADGAGRHYPYGAFFLYQEDANGDFADIEQSIVFTLDLVYYFPDGTELVIEMGRDRTTFKTRAYAQFFSMIQARLRSVPRPDRI